MQFFTLIKQEIYSRIHDEIKYLRTCGHVADGWVEISKNPILQDL